MVQTTVRPVAVIAFTASITVSAEGQRLDWWAIGVGGVTGVRMFNN